MKFKFEGELYKVWWYHQTPQIVRENLKRKRIFGTERMGRLWRPKVAGTFCFIQRLDKNGVVTAGFSRLHKLDMYKKSTGRFISFHVAFFEFLCKFPRDLREVWQLDLKNVFGTVLSQYKDQLQGDFTESNLRLINDITRDYTRNPWL